MLSVSCRQRNVFYFDTIKVPTSIHIHTYSPIHYILTDEQATESRHHDSLRTTYLHRYRYRNEYIVTIISVHDNTDCNVMRKGDATQPTIYTVHSLKRRQFINSVNLRDISLYC